MRSIALSPEGMSMRGPASCSPETAMATAAASTADACPPLSAVAD